MPRVTTFSVLDIHVHDSHHRKLIIEVRTRHTKHLQDAFEETVDNKAGYRTERTAERMGECYDALMEAGHVTVFESDYSDHIAVQIDYLQYEQGERADGLRSFCDPQFDVSARRMETIMGSQKLLLDIARRAAKVRGWDFDREHPTSHMSDPYRVIDVLRSMKNVHEVETVGPELFVKHDIATSNHFIVNKVNEAPDEVDRRRANLQPQPQGATH